MKMRIDTYYKKKLFVLWNYKNSEFADTLSWCYSSSEGKKAVNKEFTEYGTGAVKGDVIGAFLDMGEETVTMTFTKNGESMVSCPTALRFI